MSSFDLIAGSNKKYKLDSAVEPQNDSYKNYDSCLVPNQRSMSVNYRSAVLLHPEMTMKILFAYFIAGCFVFLPSYLSFTFSFEAGIFVSALLLELFSRIFLNNHSASW